MKKKFINEIIDGKDPYLIAEIGVNHEGDLDLAKKLIDQAKEGGADAAKFQSYKANKLASKHSPSYWDNSKESTKSQYELFKKYDNFSEKDYYDLYEHCKNVKIDFLSTPFDEEAINFLDPLVSFFKIASADITNVPFLRQIASKNKPIILSTGASYLSEIENAINIIKEVNDVDISLLHCILNYPTINKNANLNMIKNLNKIYPEFIIGYSDHTLPDKNMITLVTSYMLGAKIIEKHFTHDKRLKGNDHYHAMDVDDIKKFREIIMEIRKLKGKNKIKKPLESESISRDNARRSIVIKNKLNFGEIIRESDITYKRPGTGISTLFWDQIIGKTVNKNLEEDHILNWDDLDN